MTSCLVECPNPSACEHGYCLPHQYSHCHCNRGNDVHTTSEEVSKELYDLTGWDETGQRHMGWINGPLDEPQYRDHFGGVPSIPAYPLGYLLRKLPENLNRPEDGYIQAWLSMDNLGSEGWQFSYRKGAARPEIIGVAETPEDAAAKLCIALVNAGIINVSRTPTV